MTIKQKIIYLFLAIFSTALLLNSSVFAADGPKTTGKKGGEGTSSRESTCRPFASDESKKKQCEEAWNKARGTKQGKAKANNSIADNVKRRASCDSGVKPPPKEPNRAYYCRAAYDEAIRAEATKRGKEAGEADALKDDKNAQDSCKEKVKFGKDVTHGKTPMEACKSAYTKARNKKEGGSENKCGDVNTYFSYGDLCKGSAKSGGQDNPIYGFLISIVNILAGLVSLAVVGGILYGAFLYTSARDSSQQTQKAIQVITDAVIALILFFALWAIINFLVPGGLFS